MQEIAARGREFAGNRPPVEIPELEGVTIISARLIVSDDGRDALVLDGDDGTSVVINVRQAPGEAPFLEVSGENVLNQVNEEFLRDD
ncbi:MAG: hypothetical protein JWL63_1978 [Rhodocyclales bacterium]|nr:hypothetical protein [Rhodocyclales bacterium]